MISLSLDPEIFTPYFKSLDMFQCLLAYSLWELDRIYILLLCEYCINLMLNWFIAFRSTISFYFSSIYFINF